MARTATIVRETSESKVELSLNLDGTGKTDIDTSVPFYNHMMTALGKYSLIDLTIKATGDTDIDAHHTVEDIAIVFGEALKQALGNKRGIRRFADATVPLDEALAKAVVDISGRPYCVVHRRAGRLRILHDRRPFHRLPRASRYGIHRHACRNLPASAGDLRP